MRALLILIALPSLAVAQTVDLTNWKLQLPVDTERRGNPDEVHQPELATFSDPNYFFFDDAAGGYIFRAHAGGVTTENSRYPRSELREMAEGGTEKASWGTDDGGTHTMTAVLAVNRLPPKKPHLVCAQIHNGSYILMIRLEAEKLFIARQDKADIVLDADYELGREFETTLMAGDGRIRVLHNGKERLAWNTKRKSCYFKTGCYLQSNPDRGDQPDAMGEVLLKSLKLSHER